jgi:hypothetical protein
MKQLATCWDDTKLNLSLCVLTHYASEDVWGNGDVAPLILNLASRTRWELASGLIF